VRRSKTKKQIDRRLSPEEFGRGDIAEITSGGSTPPSGVFIMTIYSNTILIPLL
jgi:hypothetical protein